MKPHRRKTYELGLLTLGVLLTLPLAGCHRTYSEMVIREGMAGPGAPAWVKGDLAGLPHSDSEVYFIGRSVVYNALDERAAVAAAREDVLQQFASLISTRVTWQSKELDARANGDTRYCLEQPGMRLFPGPELAQAIARDAALFSSGIAGDLVERAVHFEQWDLRLVKEGLDDRVEVDEEQKAGVYDADYLPPFDPHSARGAVRWKCWILMSIPREKLERRIEDFRALVRDAYQRYLEDRQRVLAWAEQDRELRIAREESDRMWAREDRLADRDEAREYRRILLANPSVHAHGGQQMLLAGRRLVAPPAPATSFKVTSK